MGYYRALLRSCGVAVRKGVCLIWSTAYFLRKEYAALRRLELGCLAGIAAILQV